MIEYLKVKAVTLAFETRVIRKRERHTLANARTLAGIYSRRHTLGSVRPEMPVKIEKALAHENSRELSDEAYTLFWGLQHHRKNVVRKEARDTHVALHFLRGKPYSTVEAFAYSRPNWDNIERMILTYSEGEDPRDVKQRFEQWHQTAAIHFNKTL
jgi:hypothetical protein